MKIYIKYTLLLLFLFIFLCVCVGIRCMLMKDIVNHPNEKYDLEKDGFVVIPNILHGQQLKQIHQFCDENEYSQVKSIIMDDPSVLKKIQSYLNKDKNYVFQDYIWIIKKSSVHTCHRDNNGDFFNDGQQFPSYTILFYIEDVEKCLGVIPSSHTSLDKNGVNMTNQIRYLPCKKGDAILFNANLIHVGALNTHDNLRIQMKISHTKDIDILSYYQNFNKVSNTSNVISEDVKHFQKNLSCMFPFVSNITQRQNIHSSRGSDNGAKIGILQKAFSYVFYGNSSFYDLPNAF